MWFLRLLVACGIFLATLSLASSDSWKSYEGYKLVDIEISRQEDVVFLTNLQMTTSIDFWHLPASVGDVAEVLFSPEELSHFTSIASEQNIRFTIRDYDVSRGVAEERARLAPQLSDPDSRLSYDYTDFNNYDAVLVEMERLVGECPAGFNCLMYSIGQSVQGRDLYVVSIRKAGESEREAVWIDATIHAREWIATTTIMFTLNRLITSYGEEPEVDGMLDTYDFYIMPVANPDGYIYSWTADRYWRKNRRHNPEGSGTCFGVDLNRNFAFYWGVSGTSSNPCSDIFLGPNPGSEPEVAAISAAVVELSSRLAAFVTIHSYGRLWLMPYGHIDWQEFACGKVDNFDELLHVTNLAANAVQATHGTSWRRGPLCEVLYDASGNSMDYVHGVAGVRFTFTPELRGTDFVISRLEILPAFTEIWNGLVAMVAAVQGLA